MALGVGGSEKVKLVSVFRTEQRDWSSFIGTKRQASVSANTRSNSFSIEGAMKSMPKRLVLCLNNDGYPASLERRKIYQAVSDRAAGQQGLIRVIDESGDDYLYPEELFAPITLPASLRKAVLAAA